MKPSVLRIERLLARSVCPVASNPVGDLVLGQNDQAAENRRNGASNHEHQGFRAGKLPTFGAALGGLAKDKA
jgi:hypothetical protein